jgi:hypothetical protein
MSDGLEASADETINPSLLEGVAYLLKTFRILDVNEHGVPPKKPGLLAIEWVLRDKLEMPRAQDFAWGR